MNYLKNKKEQDEIIFSEDILMNQIINDILKITNNKYQLEIFNLQMTKETFAHSLFKIIRIFTLYRQDIIYSKEIAYIGISGCSFFNQSNNEYFQQQSLEQE